MDENTFMLEMDILLNVIVTYETLSEYPTSLKKDKEEECMSGRARERNWTGTETLFGTYFVPGAVVKSMRKNYDVMWIERRFQIWVSVNGDDDQSHQRLACDSGGLYIGQTRVESVCYTTSHMEVIYERDQNLFHIIYLFSFLWLVYISVFS